MSDPRRLSSKLLCFAHVKFVRCLFSFSCRLVQKAIRSIEQKDLSKLVSEFKGHVINLIHDSHGNHVIQRCIQAQSFFAKEAQNAGNMDMADEIMDQLQFIIDDVIGSIDSLSLHRYGCRVVQRSIEFCMERQRNAVLEAIIACNESIVEDLYGNYVVQQAIITGTEFHREQILNTLMLKQGNIFRLSKQKYASNVVEKLMQHGADEQKNLLLEEILKVTSCVIPSFCRRVCLTSFCLQHTDPRAIRPLFCNTHGSRSYCELCC